jgi:hypothetical protein
MRPVGTRKLIATVLEPQLVAFAAAQQGERYGLIGEPGVAVRDRAGEAWSD